ncbi:hypothetical protein NKR23_g921 [Pleurostoma richardsiae]|uniref:Uncharacterized protein n=1 Tax=Pleurostoma richardsiae TaxID=41990 RepID=A0AA38VPL3_9PEZI|nr:hypothetical protein NKR23_g921 [Pleurostoma richardsiae]
MEDDAHGSSRDDHDVKAEEGSADVEMVDSKPKYKSWKKKYRKMRVKFDECMTEGEELYRLEQKALSKAKQLAVFNDRLLALLLDINNSHQIPTDKRIDLRLDAPVSPADPDEAPVLELDKEPLDGPQPGKSLQQLLREVPHLDYAATAERFPDRTADLEAPVDSPAAPAAAAADPSRRPHPPTFLTADDIDNYTYEVDLAVAARRRADAGDELELLPTMAPLARENGASGGTGGANGTAGGGGSGAAAGRDTPGPAGSGASSSRDFALRNPTSVYNWLRKNAPKVFLQDEENASEKKGRGGGGGGGGGHGGGDDDDNHTPRGGARSRKSAGGERAASSRGARSSKRASAAHSRDKRKSVDDSMEYLDDELGFLDAAGTPTAAGASGERGAGAAAAGAAGSTGKGGAKRKRQADDDPGYRPKGGSNRPTKKKRKSLGGADGDGTAATPTAATKRARKSAGAASVAEDSVMED